MADETRTYATQGLPVRIAIGRPYPVGQCCSERGCRGTLGRVCCSGSIGFGSLRAGGGATMCSYSVGTFTNTLKFLISLSTGIGERLVGKEGAVNRKNGLSEVKREFLVKIVSPIFFRDLAYSRELEELRVELGKGFIVFHSKTSIVTNMLAGHVTISRNCFPPITLELFFL